MSCSSLAPQELLDPLGAVAVKPLAGDVVGVLVADDPVVGGDEEAALGVDRLRQLRVGDRPLPLELAPPARLRQVGAAAAAQRQAADQLVADRAVAVGPDQVRGGWVWPSSLATRSGPEAISSSSNMPAKAVGSSSACQRSASGSASSAPSASLTIGPWWVIAHVERHRLVAALDRDLLAHGLQRPPLVFEQVAPRPRSARRRGPGRRPSRW